MKKWGIIITAFYVFALLALVLPFAYALTGINWQTMPGGWEWYPWIWDELGWATEDEQIFSIFLAAWCAVLIAGQALLLFVSVDTSFRRLRPRRHVLLSVASISLTLALLCLFAVLAVGVAIQGDDLGGPAFLALLPLWLLWGLIFYRYKAGMPDKIEKMTRWLIKGSILELLIVVPCHVIVRQRGDCCAPGITAFGIATGIAVMLLAFGPSVLFLYQKRLGEYRRPDPVGDN